MNAVNENYRELNTDDTAQVTGAKYLGYDSPSSGTVNPDADYCGHFDKKWNAATDETLCKNCHYLEADLTCRLAHG